MDTKTRVILPKKKKVKLPKKHPPEMPPKGTRIPLDAHRKP